MLGIKNPPILSYIPYILIPIPHNPQTVPRYNFCVLYNTTLEESGIIIIIVCIHYLCVVVVVVWPI